MDSIVVTLTEMTTISGAFYLFVFRNVTTKEVVKWVAGADLSTSPNRYNEYEIPTATLFADKELGQWLYQVYESAVSTTNEAGLNEVENGKMNLKDNETITYKQYQPLTNYKTYAG